MALLAWLAGATAGAAAWARTGPFTRPSPARPTALATSRGNGKGRRSEGGIATVAGVGSVCPKLPVLQISLR